MEGVREGEFGVRILYAGVIFPNQIQRTQNFKGGGAGFGGGGCKVQFWGSFLYVMCFVGT